MYICPVQKYEKVTAREIGEKLDELVIKTIKDIGIDVDKDELVKALEYDRDQYYKGYADGKAALIHCKDCRHNGSVDTDCPIDWPGKEYCNFGER